MPAATIELAAAAPPRGTSLRALLARHGPRLAAWVAGFVPVLYVALRGGGYDLVVRSEVGLVAWWIVLIGVLVGWVSIRGIGRLGWVAVALLLGFAVWTAVAAAWSQSAEQTVAELGRVEAYLGFFILGLCVVRRATAGALVTGIGAALGVISALAVLSRLAPSLFASDQLARFFPGSQARLSYPLNYANGTGELLALGIPLLLMIASGARTLAGRALGAAALPVAVLGIVMTASRGGVLTAIVALLAFYLLAPDRLPRLATGLIAGAGSAALIGALLARDAVRDGLSTPLAVSERHQLLLLVIVVCSCVGVAQAAISLAGRHIARPRQLTITPRRAGWLTLVGVAAALVIAVAAGLPGQLAHQWREFKRTDVTGVVSGDVYSRLGTAAGSDRYQYWRAAVHAFESKPLLGIGPGTYQFYWAQHASLDEFVRNAHSLYLETLAETGVVGFVLIAGFLLVLLGAGVARALRAPPAERAVLAAATASLVAFCAAAAYDWVWQLPVTALVALLLGAAVLRSVPNADSTAVPAGLDSVPDGGDSTAVPAGVDSVPDADSTAVPAGVGSVPDGGDSTPVRAVLAVAAICAIVAIAIPFGATAAIRSSQSEVKAGHLSGALADAATAQRLEPYAATPRLQRALVLERAGDLSDARAAIAQAAAREPTDSGIWLVRARIDAESGHEAAAARDYGRAHALNPLSPTTALGG